MRLRSLREGRGPKLMVIPMIDIIFFLLVFFMMSTLYMTEQKEASVNLPQVSAQAAKEGRGVAVTVLSGGNVLFDGEEIPRRLLRERVEAVKRRDPDCLFILRSDEKTEYGYVVGTLDELKAAGAKRLAIAVERKPEQ